MIQEKIAGKNLKCVFNKFILVFTKTWARELGPKGIRVNAVRPGLIETEIHADMGDAERTKRLTPMVPMKRTGAPEEVAEAVLWLLSDQASYVTGTHVDIGGGR